MSAGGTQAARAKGEARWFAEALFARLRVLRPRPHEVLILELPHGFFNDQDPDVQAAVQQFVKSISAATGGREVFLVPEGKLHTSPPLRETMPQDSRVEVPRPRVLLPGGVRIDPT